MLIRAIFHWNPTRTSKFKTNGILVVVVKGRRCANLLLRIWCICRSAAKVCSGRVIDKVLDCGRVFFTFRKICYWNGWNFKISVLFKMRPNSFQQTSSVSLRYKWNIHVAQCYNGHLPVYHPTVCSYTRSYQLLLYLKLPVIVEKHHGSPNRHLEMSTQITINSTEFHQMESDLFIKPRY